VAVQRDLDDPGSVGDLGDFRLLGVDWKAHDPIHFGLDFVEGTGLVGPQIEFGDDDTDSLVGHRCQTANALDRLDPLFDPLDDSLFDLFG